MSKSFQKDENKKKLAPKKLRGTSFMRLKGISAKYGLFLNHFTV